MIKLLHTLHDLEEARCVADERIERARGDIKDSILDKLEEKLNDVKFRLDRYVNIVCREWDDEGGFHKDIEKIQTELNKIFEDLSYLNLF